MNAIEKKVLTHLYHSKRSSLSQMAKDLKLSRTQVEYALECFQTKNYVKHFYPVLDYQSLGYSFYVFTLLKTNNKKSVHSIKRKILSEPFCISCGNAQGEFDLFANLRFKNKKEFLKWSKKNNYLIKFIIPEHLEFYDLKYFNKKESIKYDLLSNKQNKIDLLDKQILMQLSKDPFMSATSIANKIKTEIRTVAYRIRALEKNRILLGNRALLNYKNLGYSLTGVFLNLDNSKNTAKILHYARQHKYVNACMIQSKQPFVYLQFFHRTIYELKEGIKDFYDKFPTSIQGSEIMLLEEESSINACSFWK